VARRRQRRQETTLSAVSADVQFERELEVFRTEAQAAAQFFFAFLAVHASAGESRSVQRLLNTAPLFWNTNLGALQLATFVVLGRIFDQDSTHNIGRLLKLAEDSRQIFSKAALAKRKQGTHATPPVWLNDYLKRAYVPTSVDFRRLHGHVSGQRKIYEANYRRLRNKVFAHKEISDAAEVSALFAGTNIREMERMLVFLLSFYEALWQLFFNGRKPVLRPLRYSVNRILRLAPAAGHSEVHARVAQEAKGFLIAASSELAARQ
jgi:AbiU2